MDHRISETAFMGFPFALLIKRTPYLNVYNMRQLLLFGPGTHTCKELVINNATTVTVIINDRSLCSYQLVRVTGPQLQLPMTNYVTLRLVYLSSWF